MLTASSKNTKGLRRLGNTCRYDTSLAGGHRASAETTAWSPVISWSPRAVRIFCWSAVGSVVE